MSNLSKAERTRQAIIEQTAPLFNKQGYAGTSLSDMTQATGLTKGSIYGNFENKEAVALAAFEYNAKQLTQRVNHVLAQCGCAYARLQAFVDFYRCNWKSVAANGGCPLMNTAVEADDHLPFLKKAVQKSFKGVADKLVRILNEGMEKGEFRCDIDPRAYAHTMIVLVEGGILLTKLYDDGKYLELALERLMRMVDEEIVK